MTKYSWKGLRIALNASGQYAVGETTIQAMTKLPSKIDAMAIRPVALRQTTPRRKSPSKPLPNTLETCHQTSSTL